MRNKYRIDGDKTLVFIDHKDGTQSITTISTSDLPKIQSLDIKWCLCRKPHGSYVTGIVRDRGRQRTIQLHRFLTDCPAGKYVDHINGDSLNNTRENLRFVSNSENLQNRRGLNSNNKSGIRGVYYDKNRNAWQVRFKKDYKTYRFGRYKTLEEAQEVAENAMADLFPHIPPKEDA